MARPGVYFSGSRDTVRTLTSCCNSSRELYNIFMIKVLSDEQLQIYNSSIIGSGKYSEVELIDKAAKEFSDAITKIARSKDLFFFCGEGKSGLEGISTAICLFSRGYNCVVLSLNLESDKSPLFEEYFEKLNSNSIHVQFINSISSFPNIPANSVIIDAISGEDINRPVSGLTSDIISKINTLNDIQVISIGLPSGINARGEVQGNPPIEADTTLTLGFPKLALFYADRWKYVGEWNLLRLGIEENHTTDIDTKYLYVDSHSIEQIAQDLSRNKFSHKGTYGHVLCVAGAKGMMGAAVLASFASLRSGAGQVTCLIPQCGYNVLQTSIPEVRVMVDPHKDYLTKGNIPLDQFNSIVIGPGIGQEEETMEAIEELLRNIHIPLVIDADGINILSRNRKLIEMLPHNSILTPHPKEFGRLIGPSSSSDEQLKKQILFSERYNQIVVLKGAHTSISLPDGSVFFNSTGNPGMATAGSGDVLAGIIAGLLAQGMAAKEAALLGVFLHGMAGDISEKKKGQNGMIARDIIEQIPRSLSMLITGR